MSVKKNENKNVKGEVGIIVTLGGKKYRGKILSWVEFNKETTRAQKSGNLMEYIGADRDYKGKMYCAFQETSVESLKKGKPDKLCLYFVENDVVFKFQENKKSIERKIYKGEDNNEYKDDLKDEETKTPKVSKTNKKATKSNKEKK